MLRHSSKDPRQKNRKLPVLEEAAGEKGLEHNSVVRELAKIPFKTSKKSCVVIPFDLSSDPWCTSEKQQFSVLVEEAG